MNKCYYRIVWKNYPDDGTPLNEQNLNKVDIAADEMDNRILSLDSTKFDKSEAQLLVKYIEYDEDTGIFKITHYNGASYEIDTLLEKLAINFDYDYQTQRLIITLSDGEVKYVDLSALITQYEFVESETIIFTVDNTGKVSAKVKEGSIEEKHLRPDYLADIRVESAKAAASAAAADASEKAAKRSEDAAKVSEINAAASAAESGNKATESATSAASAASSAGAASQKATEAANSAADAQASAEVAAESAADAEGSAETASQKVTEAEMAATNAAAEASKAEGSANAAAEKADEASDFATEAESFAHGGTGTRPGEDTDNAHYWYEQTKAITGDIVTGVKGDAEDEYRTGLVNIRPEDIGVFVPGESVGQEYRFPANSPGWYRIAKFKRSDSASAESARYAQSISCLISIRRSYSNIQPEYHLLNLACAENLENNRFVVISRIGNIAIDKIRAVYVEDGNAYYLDVKYDTNTENYAYFQITSNYAAPSAVIGDYNHWLMIEPIHVGSDSYTEVIAQGDWFGEPNFFVDNYALPLTGGTVTGNTIFKQTLDVEGDLVSRKYFNLMPWPGYESLDSVYNAGTKLWYDAKTRTIKSDTGGAAFIDLTSSFTYYFRPVEIPANANLNSYMAPGTYQCPANTTAETLSNCPTVNAFSLLVLAHRGAMQLLIEYVTTAPKWYTRNYYSYDGTWGAWRNVFVGDSANQMIAPNYMAIPNTPKGEQYFGTESTGNILYTSADGIIRRGTVAYFRDNILKMKGATVSAAGGGGCVPVPSAGSVYRGLCADGTWAYPDSRGGLWIRKFNSWTTNDARNSNTTPNLYNGTAFLPQGIKFYSAIGLAQSSSPNANDYAQVYGGRMWDDSSGGYAYEFAWGSKTDDYIYYRRGDTTSWQSWRHFITSENIGSQTVSKSTVADMVKGSYINGGGALGPNSIVKGSVRFDMMNAFKGLSGFGSYCNVMSMNCYTGSDVPYTSALAISKNGSTPKAWIATGTETSESWAYQTELITTANIASKTESLRQKLGTTTKNQMTVSGNTFIQPNDVDTYWRLCPGQPSDGTHCFNICIPTGLLGGTSTKMLGIGFVYDNFAKGYNGCISFHQRLGGVNGEDRGPKKIEYGSTSMYGLTVQMPDMSGTITVTPSDIRLKENIKDTDINALKTIDKIKMRQFDWKFGRGHQDIGVIANELETIDPHFILYGTGTDELDERGNIKNPKCIDTFYMQGYLIKAIQELHTIVKEQAKEISDLKRQIESLQDLRR